MKMTIKRKDEVHYEDVARHGTRKNNTRQGQTVTLSKDTILT